MYGGIFYGHQKHTTDRHFYYTSFGIGNDQQPFTIFMVASKVQSLFLCDTHLLRHTIIKVGTTLCKQKPMLNGSGNKLRKYIVADVKSAWKSNGTYKCVH